MKHINKIISAAAGAAILFSSSSSFAATGDIAGNLYYTDIKTYIYHSPITSYNIGGKTVIDAEILNWHYGFDVYWIAEDRHLDITDKGGDFNSLQAMGGGLVESAEGEVGTVFGPYYETDIVTTLNGSPIESYNIGGRTFIVAEAMRDFGYNVDWDADARTLTITKPMDFYKIETDYGTIKSTYDHKRKTAYVISENNLILTDENYDQYELELSSGQTLQGPGVGDSYIRLSDVQAALNAECSLVEQTIVSHTDWVNGISYDTPYYSYYIDLKFNESDMPEAKPSSGTAGLFGPRVQADIYSLPIDLVVNGESVPMLAIAGGKTYETYVWIVDGKIYIPKYTFAKLLGYQY
ncbi:MAG: hypothetical protein J1G06_01640 [Oscillospiraceae bacterium]|nr:hypothetical protein [Oscillospiraceae bacterium]